MENFKSPKNLESLLTIAIEAAYRASHQLKKGVQSREILTESATDIKITGDKLAEKVICDLLKRETPFPILSEESGWVISGDPNQPTWIVDPLDGTYNFFRGIPLYAVSIGLFLNDKPLLGVVLNPEQDELYTGIPDSGAWLNGNPLRVSSIFESEKASLATGFPAGMDRDPEKLQRFIGLMAPFKKIRMIGSAALALTYVARGWFDLYYEESIRLWDIAGGAAILLGAGGSYHSKMLKGDPTLLQFLGWNGCLKLPEPFKEFTPSQTPPGNRLKN